MNWVTTVEQGLPAEVIAWLDCPNDATKAGAALLRRANQHLRGRVWPEPYCRTRHRALLGDARDMRAVGDGSIELVVTSPPYWTLKTYEDSRHQMGSLADYEEFLGEFEVALGEIQRVLVAGGRACINVGDVCVSRKEFGRHMVFPLHADIQVMARRVGLDCLTPILWHKIANGRNEVARSGSGFYGKPYQPGAIIKNDIEHILFLRKPGAYRNPTPMQKALSLLDEAEMKTWFRSVWSDIRGASTKSGHPAPYPVALAERLIRMFSFAGDTVLDPFAGSGTTGIAAMRSGRNSVQVEIGEGYVQLMRARLMAEAGQVGGFQIDVAVTV